MSVDIEIRDRLITEVPIVASRIYPMKLPQNATFPAIRYNRISTNRGYTMIGSDCLPSTRFQVDVFANTFTEARSVFDLVRKAFDGFEAIEIVAVELDNETDDYEDDTGLFRVIGDFIFQHTEQP